MSTIQLTAENGTQTLTSIKRHIYDFEGKITTEMTNFLITLATRAYEIKKADNPRICAASFVVGTISNAQIWAHNQGASNEK